MMNISSFWSLLLLLCLSGAFPCLGDGKQANKESVMVVQSPPLTAVEADPKLWKEFLYEPGRFRIMFPGTPVEADNSSGSMSGRKLTLNTGVFYFAGYQDMSASEAAEFEKNELRKLLFDKIRDAVRAAIDTQTKVKLLEEIDISINGYPGRSTKIGMENGNVLRQHNYLVGPRMYQIFVVTPKELLATDGGKFDELRAAKFLNSFKLAVAENGWRAYSSTQGRFAVTFPGTPAETDNSYDTPFGRCDARDYVVNASAEYRVSYTDFVVDLEQDSKYFNQLLDQIRDRVVADSKAKVLSETAISIDGHPGRMMKLAAPDGSITRSKSYGVGKRLYQVMVTTSRALQAAGEGQFDELSAARFFDSFKLARPE